MEREINWDLQPGVGVGPLQLGAARANVLARLRLDEIAWEADDADVTYGEIIDADVWLFFDDEPPHPLLQLHVEDDRLLWRGDSILNRPLYEVFAALRVPLHDTRWRNDDLHLDEPTALDREALAPATDQELLWRGTLWIVSLGIGLSLTDGVVTRVFLRSPHHVPAHGLGPLTDEQRWLAEQPNLPDLLRPTALPGAWQRKVIHGGLTLGLMAVLAAIGWQGIQYQQRWNNAPVAEGTVIAVQPPPPEPFPSEFTIAYTDGSGRTHQTVFHTADVYVVREVGQKVEVRYLPEAPDEPIGPARYRDAAFLTFTPYAIAAVAVYLVLQALAAIALRFVLPV